MFVYRHSLHFQPDLLDRCMCNELHKSDSVGCVPFKQIHKRSTKRICFLLSFHLFRLISLTYLPYSSSTFSSLEFMFMSWLFIFLFIIFNESYIVLLQFARERELHRNCLNLLFITLLIFG